jgi:hypothetical protein
MALRHEKVAMRLAVYNGANYLMAAIDSMLTQSYGDFDFLISDNASTDGTAAHGVLVAADFLAACVDVLDSAVSPISGR